jgi:hypothetical protein
VSPLLHVLLAACVDLESVLFLFPAGFACGLLLAGDLASSCPGQACWHVALTLRCFFLQSQLVLVQLVALVQLPPVRGPPGPVLPACLVLTLLARVSECARVPQP